MIANRCGMERRLESKKAGVHEEASLLAWYLGP